MQQNKITDNFQESSSVWGAAEDLGWKSNLEKISFEVFTETYTGFYCHWEFIPNVGCSNRETNLAQVQFSSGNLKLLWGRWSELSGDVRLIDFSHPFVLATMSVATNQWIVTVINTEALHVDYLRSHWCVSTWHMWLVACDIDNNNKTIGDGRLSLWLSFEVITHFFIIAYFDVISGPISQCLRII